VSKLLEITRIQIAGSQAFAYVGDEVIAAIGIQAKGAPEALLRRLHEKGYTSKQIRPSPDGSRLLIWI
jgi:hypothetical protein